MWLKYSLSPCVRIPHSMESTKMETVTSWKLLSGIRPAKVTSPSRTQLSWQNFVQYPCYDSVKWGGLIHFLAKWQRGIRARGNMRSPIWKEKGEKKNVEERKKWDCWWGWVSVLRGCTTWTMNTRNEIDHNHHPLSLVSSYFSDIFNVFSIVLQFKWSFTCQTNRDTPPYFISVS